MSETAEPLIKFRAGLMNREAGTNTVKADARKGNIEMYVGAEDDLLHFVWKERTTSDNSEPELNLIVFPEDAEFKHIPHCTTGRCYALKFRSSNQLKFFWMQGTAENQDKTIADRINALISNPADRSLPDLLSSTVRFAGETTSKSIEPQQGESTMEDKDIKDTLILNDAGPSESKQDAQLDENSRSKFADDISAYIQRLSQNQTENATSHHQNKGHVSIQEILGDCDVRSLLEDDVARSNIVDQLPTELDAQNLSRDKLFSILNSPYVRQALDSLNYALYNYDAEKILPAMGLSMPAAKEDDEYEEGVILYLRALNKKIDQEETDQHMED